jgi:predicted DNA-binding transcriptional regulator AlpA
MKDALMDIQDLENRLKIPKKTIRNKLSNGTWPIQPVRIGRALRWRESDVAEAIANLEMDRERRPEARRQTLTPIGPADEPGRSKRAGKVRSSL